jgi:hypothetical protein
MWSTCLLVVALVVPVGGLEATVVVVQVVMAALGVLVATVVVVPGVMAALVVEEEGQAMPTPSLGQHASTLAAFHKATQA